MFVVWRAADGCVAEDLYRKKKTLLTPNAFCESFVFEVLILPKSQQESTRLGEGARAESCAKEFGVGEEGSAVKGRHSRLLGGLVH